MRVASFKSLSERFDRLFGNTVSGPAPAVAAAPPPSSFLFNRIREALAPAYIVERELGAGGSSVVFLGRDTALDRTVAIKVVRPEHATAHMLVRFTREARLLANLNHPHIIPIYTAGEAGGLYYYVMQYVQGEVLADRLARGALSARTTTRLGLDILDALASAHRAGIVHRDVSARNVFIVDGRALIGDLGIATSPDYAASAASGTIGSMSPEQASGATSTPADDVYAVGALLYRALKGTPWPLSVADDRAVWSGIPYRLARVLRRALQWAPADRYPDAAAFRADLKRASHSRLLGVPVLGAAAAAIMLWLWPRPAGEDLRQSELAILPFDVVSVSGDTLVGRHIARLVAHSLDGIPDLQLTPIDYAFRWSDHEERTAAPPNYAALKAKYYVKGDVVQRGDSLDARIRVYERNGRVNTTIRGLGTASAFAAVADSIALELLRHLHPRLSGHFGERTPVGRRSLTVTTEFLRGEDAFLRGDWKAADRHFRAALEDDSTFLLARWRLLNVWRWQPTVVPDPQIDLAGLYAAYGSSLSELDTLLIKAQITPPGRERIAQLKRATEQFPRDGYAALLYADELFHRGPFVGRPLRDALHALEQAASLDRYLEPAHEHMAWAAIRLGERDRARRALDQLRIVAPAEVVDLDTRALFEQAYVARFDPERAKSQLQSFFDLTQPGALDVLQKSSRAGLQVGLPHAQRMLANLLLSAPDATASARADAHEAIALASFTLGQTSAGLVHLDSAAFLFGTPEARLESAEWRVLGAALGWPQVSDAEADAARARLQQLARRPELPARASWALIVDQLARGRIEEAAAATDRFGRLYRDQAGTRLADNLQALLAGARGEYERALSLSEGVLRFDAHGEAGDPFARSVIHLRRAQWHHALGNLVEAEAELLWAENQDLVGWPSRTAQAVEVDWTFTLYALLHRAALARERGAVRDACALLQDARAIAVDELPSLPTAPVSRQGCMP